MPLTHTDKKKGKKTHRASGFSTRNTIDEAGKESFPSSDPPAWTLGSKIDYEKILLEETNRQIAHLLLAEHATIRAVVQALSKMIITIKADKTIDVEKLKDIALFFQDYVENCHHKKEEMLFSVLQEGEEHPSQYLLNDLKKEHQHADLLSVTLDKQLHNYKAKDIKATEQLITLLKEIANLHLNHNDKEEEYIFPLLKQHLDHQMVEKLIHHFQEIDETLKPKTYADWQKFAETLTNTVR